MHPKLAEVRSRAQAKVMGGATAKLYALGYTPKSLEEAQRDTIWWIWARVQAAMNARLLMRGQAIAWTSAGYAELVPAEVPRPGRGRVSVLITHSAVSPGTERAQYLRLPNTQVGILGSPGYSAAGFVHEVGPGVRGLAPGDRVAVTGAKHASITTTDANHVHPIPGNVSNGQGSLVMLGVICSQGLRLARLEPEEQFAVVGAGAIGTLTMRLAARGNPGGTMIAASHRRRRAAGDDARFLVTGTDDEDIRNLRAPVVFEATGDPEAIRVAIEAASEDGRIILLGSARGLTRAFDFDAVRSKGLTLIGAHVDTIDIEAERTSRDARSERATEFLAQLSDGLGVADIVGPPINPYECANFYRELAAGSNIIGAHFDWTKLDDRARAARGHLLSPPNFTGRGMDAKWPIRPPRSSVYRPRRSFADARGDLRIGMIGCGDIAVQNAAAAKSAPNVELIACFDPIRALAAELASKHGATTCATAEELLSRQDIDAVVLSVPHHLHAPLGVMTADAGKHVIVEKPLAKDLLGALELCTAASRNRVHVSVCFPQRYDPAALMARRMIDDDALGEFSGGNIRLFLDKSPAYWRGGFSGRAQSDWRRSRRHSGGGILIMNLSHHIDLLRHLAGLEIETVTAQTAVTEEGMEVEDSIAMEMEFCNGALGALVGYSAVRGSTEEEFSIWGHLGRIILSPKPRVYSLQRVDSLRPNRWHSFGVLPPSQIRAVYLSRLASALADGAPPEVSAEDGLATQAIIEAAYASAESNRPVRPAELLSRAQTMSSPSPIPT